jgi:hypothetical protein
VQYWRGIGLGEWDWIGVGAGWPQGQLESKIDEHLRSGRRVFLDTDPRWWLPCSWHVSEIEELAKIEQHFHFKEVAPSLYEIRALEDHSAKDQPHLEICCRKEAEEVKDVSIPGDSMLESDPPAGSNPAGVLVWN